MDDPYEQLAAEKMTPERAKRIRHLRVELGYSWRKVGTTVWKEWGEKGSGGFIGYALCAVAARSFGEDPYTGLWNGGDAPSSTPPEET
jgi:hypothetical protein